EAFMAAILSVARRKICGLVLPLFSQDSRPAIAPSLAIFISILLAAGIAVRIRLYLTFPSYWYDEAYLLLNVFHRSWFELIGRNEHSVVCPPIYLWIQRALFLMFGGAEWSMRLPAFVAGVAALPLIAVLARRVGGASAWIP